MKKIGIMGGTFNPIHMGHLLLAESALHQFCLDEVLIMPTGNPYYKKIQESVTEADRVNMVKLAIADNEHFVLSLQEIEREGATYTVETLEELTSKYPENEYYFIMGEDSLYHIESWKEPEKIARLAVLLVAGRYEGPAASLMSQIEYIEDKYDADIRYINSPTMEISSNDIRKRVKEGRSIKYLVKDEVAQYIYTHHLYV